MKSILFFMWIAIIAAIIGFSEGVSLPFYLIIGAKIAFFMSLGLFVGSIVYTATKK